MLSIDDIKKQASEKLLEKSNDISNKVLTIKENIEDTVDNTKDNVNSLKESIVDTVENTKGAVKDFSVVEKIKEFSFNATNIVTEIDKHLIDKNIPFEVSNFRVSANVGVVAGMVLDINFSKTQDAKNSSNEIRVNKSNEANHIVVKNPATGKTYKIAKTTLIGKEEVKIRDSETGQIIVINAKTGDFIRADEAV
jgi:hypothetical protein